MSSDRVSGDSDVVEVVLDACGLLSPRSEEERLMVRAVRAALPDVLDLEIRHDGGLGSFRPREQWEALKHSECMKSQQACSKHSTDKNHLDCGGFNRRSLDPERRRRLNFRWWLGRVMARAVGALVASDGSVLGRVRAVLAARALTLAPALMRKERGGEGNWNIEPTGWRQTGELDSLVLQLLDATREGFLEPDEELGELQEFLDKTDPQESAGERARDERVVRVPLSPGAAGDVGTLASAAAQALARPERLSPSELPADYEPAPLEELLGDCFSLLKARPGGESVFSGHEDASAYLSMEGRRAGKLAFYPFVLAGRVEEPESLSLALLMVALAALDHEAMVRVGVGFSGDFPARVRLRDLLAEEANAWDPEVERFARDVRRRVLEWPRNREEVLRRGWGLLDRLRPGLTKLAEGGSEVLGEVAAVLKESRPHKPKARSSSSSSNPKVPRGSSKELKLCKAFARAGEGFTPPSMLCESVGIEAGEGSREQALRGMVRELRKKGWKIEDAQNHGNADDTGYRFEPSTLERYREILADSSA